MSVKLVNDIEVGDERRIAVELAVVAILDCIIGGFPVEDLGGEVVLHVCRST
jgi:small basic protein